MKKNALKGQNKQYTNSRIPFREYKAFVPKWRWTAQANFDMQNMGGDPVSSETILRAAREYTARGWVVDRIQVNRWAVRTWVDLK